MASNSTQLFTQIFLEAFWRYFRVQLEGLEHLPKKGPVIVYANHSGWAGLDAIMLGYGIYHQHHRVPRMLAHRFWFSQPWMGYLAAKFGLVQAKANAGIHLLQRNHLVVIFPEGEQGNFKPSSQMYRVTRFHSGLVRMALATGAPVVPATIIGAEESQINLGRVVIKRLLGKEISIPLPLAAFPLPSRWRIKFHPLIDPKKYRQQQQDDPFQVERITRLWQKRLQVYLLRELKRRDGVFINRKRLHIRKPKV